LFVGFAFADSLAVTLPGIAFVGNATIYREAYTVIPAVAIPQYSTLIVQPSVSDATVKVLGSVLFMFMLMYFL
jgi:hypothetical protein